MLAALRVLGVFPHPDDEAYSCGGTMARFAAGGALVQVVCATAGEAGQDLRPDGEQDAVGSVRRQELACACDALGLLPPRFLAVAGLEDGRVAEVDFPAAVGAIVREIRSFRPDIVLSLGGDGVYGHPDHLALYRLLVAAFGAAAGGERFPEREFGAPGRPRRFAAAYPRGMFRPMYEHMLGSEYTSAIRGLDPDSLGLEPAEIQASIDIKQYAAQKLNAIRCHRSQLQGGIRRRCFPATWSNGCFRLNCSAWPAGRRCPAGFQT